jgi:predicted amidohydrolase YtcJ
VARLVLAGGRIVTLSPDSRIADAVLIDGARIAAVGTLAEMRALAGPGALERDVAGHTVIPGLIDAHAHLDREGLKDIFPSLAGASTTDEVVDRIRALAAAAQPGAWIVTMPLGSPPQYRDAPPPPDRRALDRAAPDNPVYIRPIWGYWRDAPGRETLVSAANSAALAIAGIGRDTPAPSPAVTICRDEAGEPTGIFEERTHASVVELVLFRDMPRFTFERRRDGLARAMRIYNSTGTTTVHEPHGIAGEVMEVWRALHRDGRLTVRAQLVHSPAWTGLDAAARVRRVAEFAGNEGDDWLRVGGMFVEIGGGPDSRARASAAPYTSWAGFHYDCGLPEDEIFPVLVAAARHRIQVSGLTTRFIGIFDRVAAEAPISGLRWIGQHLGIATAAEIALLQRHDIGITPLAKRFIDKEGNAPGNPFGNPADDTFMPIRTLMAKGIRMGLETDNVPPTLWAAIHQVVARHDRFGQDVAPASEKLTREQALRAATLGSASLMFREGDLGSIEPGKFADLVALSADPLTCDEDELPHIVAEMTMVGGRIVYEL